MEKQNMVYPYHGVLHHLTVKRNAVLIHTLTWINLENVMLSERTNHERAQCMI